MTWLTFRQFRAQAITALAAVAVLAVAYGYTGPHLADLYNKTGLTRVRQWPALPEPGDDLHNDHEV